MEKTDEGQAILWELQVLRRDVGKLHEKMSFLNKVVDDRLAEMRLRLAHEKRLISEVKVDTDKVNKSVKQLNTVVTKLTEQLEKQGVQQNTTSESQKKSGKLTDTSGISAEPKINA